MNRQDIRVSLWQYEDLFEEFKSILFPDGIKFCNPDFLVFSEEDARAGKVFDDDSTDFPSESDCEEAWVEAKKKIQEVGIRMEYAVLMSNVAKPYSPEERETWFMQRKECEAYVADSSAPTPFIDNMAAARGITRMELLAKIQENMDLYDTAIAGLLGAQQKAIDEIE